MIETVYAILEKLEAFLKLAPERILFLPAFNLLPLNLGIMRKNVS